MKYIIALVAPLTLMQAQANAQDYQYAQSQGAIAQPVLVQPVQVQAPQPAPAAKRTVIYDERTNELVEVQPQVQQAPIQQPQAQPFGNYQPSIQQPVIQQTIVRPVQEAPVSVVQDSALSISPAESKRKARQDMEVKTEQKIVEKLEEARMEDEKARADRLFNNGFSSGRQNQPVEAPVAQAAPQPVQQVVVPAQVVTPVAAPVAKEEDKVDIRAEIRTAFEEHTKKKPEQPGYYISGLVGMGKYPDVVNVRGNIATGVSLGIVTAERVVVEGSFLYATYQLEDVTTSASYYPRIVDMRQYNVGAALKYQLLPGRIRPMVGGAVDYARRSMSEMGYDFRTSDAFDVGFVAGLDLQLTDNFGIGLDFRYMTNITYRDNSNYPQSFVLNTAQNPIEKLDYYMGTLSGKLSF
jgi:outer membrane protein W